MQRYDLPYVGDSDPMPYMVESPFGIYVKHHESQTAIDELEDNIKQLTMLMVKGMHFDRNGLNIRLGGPGAMMYMNYLVNLFKVNGGENFLTIGLAGGGHKYGITIQNCDGQDTPAEKMERMEAENKGLQTMLEEKQLNIL